MDQLDFNTHLDNVVPNGDSVSPSDIMDEKQPEQLTFEEALNELDAVVRKLQSSDLTLRQSMVLFQRGSELVGLCRNQLDEAEQEIKVLLEDRSGALEEVDFLPEEGV